MVKKKIMFNEVLFEDSLENYLSREITSICQFLYFLCIEDIAKHVERTFYTKKSWHFKYSVSSLTEKEAILLSFYDENGQIQLPSGGTLHHFVKYRLGEEGVNEVMMLLGEKILKLSSTKEAKIDSTPLEASKKMNADLDCYSADGGYDSFLIIQISGII